MVFLDRLATEPRSITVWVEVRVLQATFGEISWPLPDGPEFHTLRLIAASLPRRDSARLTLPQEARIIKNS